jgi:hypothetical protein
MKLAGHVECMEDMRNAYNILVRKPEGKERLEDLRVDGNNLIMDCKEVVWKGMDWIHL